MNRKDLLAAFVGRRTAANLALPAGGIRRPHLRRLTHWGRRSCGNAWSLYVMCRRVDKKYD